MMVLSGFVMQTIRHRFVPMYVLTVWRRMCIGTNLIWFYTQTSDRLFLNIFTILLVGISLTLLGLWCDHHKP